MISIKEAAQNGIKRLRMPRWANRDDYIEIDIIDRKPGPWTHLWSPMNESCNGRNPVDILITRVDADAIEWEIWQTV